MKITLNKDFEAKLNFGTDFNLKKQGLATLSFGQTQRLNELKKALKQNPADENLKSEFTFAAVENQKLRETVKKALTAGGVAFNYGKTQGSFGSQKWQALSENEKYEKGVFVIDQPNIEKLADFLKSKGIEKIQVETSYLGKIKKYESDHLYMAEVKKIRNSNLYQEHVHYDSEKKQFSMSVEGLKKGMDIEKKDDMILKTAMNKNLDSVKEIYAIAGLNEKDIAPGLVSARENGETVIITQKYFFAGMNKESFEKAPTEVKEMMHDINKERIAALKENFKNISWDKVGKTGWVISKSDNPDWKEKLEEYKKVDAGYCKEKTKELEAPVQAEIKNFVNNFGSIKPQTVSL